MTRTAPLLLLALAACAAPMDQAFPTRDLVVDKGGQTFHVRSQFDPVTFAWVNRVWSVNPALSAADRDRVMALVAEDVGAAVCEGGRLVIGEGEIWNGLAGSKRQFNAGTGEWRLVGTCA